MPTKSRTAYTNVIIWIVSQCALTIIAIKHTILLVGLDGLVQPYKRNNLFVQG